MRTGDRRVIQRATLVLDASAVVDVLLRTKRGERLARMLAARDDEDVVEDLVTVAHLDAEVLAALARGHRAGELDTTGVTAALRLLSEMALTRVPISGDLLEAAWALRHNVFANDALYVALARALGASLVTTDARLARAVPDIAVGLDDHDDTTGSAMDA